MIELKNIEGSELINILDKVFQKENITGVVYCENSENKAISKVFIKSGTIIYAASPLYGEKFGDIMVKKSIISSKELEKALRFQKDYPEKLIGSILVEMGVISDRVIPSLLYRQIEIIIYEIVVCKNCNIKFEECDIEEHSEYKNKISDSSGLNDYNESNKLFNSTMFLRFLKTNLQEIIKIRRYFSNTSLILKRFGDNLTSQLNFDQRRILRTVNGKSTLHDIIILSDLDYFRTYKIIFELILEKVIKIDDLNINDKNKEILEEPLIPLENNYTFNYDSENELITGYQTKIEQLQKELINLNYKLTNYENINIILGEDIISKINNLNNQNKLILSNIIKNVLDMS